MKSRTQSIQIARQTHFDLLIIGGGMAGAAIAYAASSAGLSVLLADKADFASGASGCTSQLFAGALTALRKAPGNYRRQLARDCLQLEKSVPHLVRRINVLMPIASGNADFGW